MFGFGKSSEEREAERLKKAQEKEADLKRKALEKEAELKRKAEEKILAKRRDTLMREVTKYVKKGWAAGDVDAHTGTASLTRATTSAFRKFRRAATLNVFSAAESDRTETMFIYLDEKGKAQVTKSRKGIITK